MDLFPAAHPVRDLKLQNATALFSQPWGFYAAQAIDRSPAAKTVANVGNPAKRNALVVQTAPCAGNDCAETLCVPARFPERRPRGHGKLRLSITDDPRETLCRRPIQRQ